MKVIRMRNMALGVGLFFQSISVSHGQISNTKELEPILKKGIEIAYAASVRMMGYDTIKNVQNSSQFSGVIVDKAGTILTVSHAIQPGRLYKVFFPDGRQAMAKALGKISVDQQKRPDLGMMRITTKGDWPVAEMGWSYSLKINEPCISIAYPETLNQLFPTVRFGRISDLSNQWQFLESTCKMEPGDSGGPLFDYQGRVIGLHSRCLENENGNYEVPIDLYRKYWNALNNPKDYSDLPSDTSSISTDPLKSQIISLPFIANLEKNLSPIYESVKGNVMVIRTYVNGREQNFYSTLFEYQGKNYLVGKSSLILGDGVVYWKGKPVQANVIARDKSNDLVLLSLFKNIGKAMPLLVSSSGSDLNVGNVGGFLVSPLANSPKISVIGSKIFAIPNRYSSAYLGASAMFNDGHAVITKVNPSGGAMKAGVNVGDKVLEIGGVPITSAEQYNSQMLKYMSGDTVSFVVQRGDSIQTKNIITSSWPLPDHIAENFLGGKSIRRDGFSHVFVHDATVQADECGGPVFDQYGRFLGINIARFSRTAVLAIPSEIIHQFIAKYSNMARREIH